MMFGVLTPISAGKPDLLSVLGLLPIGYFFSLLAVGLFGAPGFIVLRFLNLVRWWSIAAGGFIIGGGVDIVLQWREFWIGSMFHIFFTYGMTGALSAFLFWLIWRQGQTEN
jgi:hypothetical protein